MGEAVVAEAMVVGAAGEVAVLVEAVVLVVEAELSVAVAVLAEADRGPILVEVLAAVLAAEEALLEAVGKCPLSISPLSIFPRLDLL